MKEANRRHFITLLVFSLSPFLMFMQSCDYSGFSAREQIKEVIVTSSDSPDGSSNEVLEQDDPVIVSALKLEDDPIEITNHSEIEYKFSLDSSYTISNLMWTCDLNGIVSSCEDMMNIEITTDKIFITLKLPGLKSGPQEFDLSLVSEQTVIGKYDFNFLVDLEPPQVTINPDFTDLSSDKEFKFDLTIKEPLSGIEHFNCRIDSDPFAACASVMSYKNLGPGDHIFDVLIADRSGNIMEKSYQWTVLPPRPNSIVFQSKPRSSTVEDHAIFKFLISDRINYVSCDIDAAGPQDCTTGISYSELSSGQHELNVTGYDRKNGSQLVTSSYKWTIGSAPEILIKTSKVTYGEYDLKDSGGQKTIEVPTSGVASYKWTVNEIVYFTSKPVLTISYTQVLRKFDYCLEAMNRFGSAKFCSSYIVTHFKILDQTLFVGDKTTSDLDIDLSSLKIYGLNLIADDVNMYFVKILIESRRSKRLYFSRKIGSFPRSGFLDEDIKSYSKYFVGIGDKIYYINSLYPIEIPTKEDPKLEIFKERQYNSIGTTYADIMFDGANLFVDGSLVQGFAGVDLTYFFESQEAYNKHSDTTRSKAVLFGISDGNMFKGFKYVNSFPNSNYVRLQSYTLPGLDAASFREFSEVGSSFYRDKNNLYARLSRFKPLVRIDEPDLDNLSLIKNLSPELYSDGKKLFLFSDTTGLEPILDLKADDFRTIRFNSRNEYVLISDDHVHFAGSLHPQIHGGTLQILNDADAIDSRYFTDRADLWFLSKSKKFLKIPGDQSSFRRIDSSYSLVGNNIYRENKLIFEEIQTDSFIRLEDNHFKFGPDIFYLRFLEAKRLRVGSDSFVSLGSGYFRRGSLVYYQLHGVPDAIASEIQPIFGSYAKDSQNVYFNQFKVSGADSDSLAKGFWSNTVYDKNWCYKGQFRKSAHIDGKICPL